jgi:ABC-type Mn2+/Zn2+ transport system permease subunit
MSYFDRALIVITIVGILTGLVGTFVVLHKRVLFAQALTHATFPGAVIGILLGVSMQLGAVVACALIVGTITLIGRITPGGAGAASGVLLAGGFAAGALAQAFGSSVPVDMTALLFGSVLSVSTTDGVLAAIALGLTLLALVFAGKHVVYAMFDPEGYRGLGYEPAAMDALIMVLTTITVVVTMPAVGAILTIALIAAPAAAARALTARLGAMLVIAPTLSVASGVLGLLLSRGFSVSAGASIALVATAFLGVALIVGRWMPRRLRGEVVA